MWILAGKEQQYHVQGAYQYPVQLTLFPQMIEDAGHVVVLAIYKGKLLFTRHKYRGLEWPGGKVEKGETPLMAAIRELEEETGGLARSMWFIGQYRVYDSKESYFVKNIYAAEISHLDEKKVSGEDTYGARLLPLHTEPNIEKGFSPLVTDGIFTCVRQSVIKSECNK